MSEVYRVCPECSESIAMSMRHCPACGYDTQGELPVQSRNLPATIGRAALPVLAGAASLALRAGWKLLQSRLAQNAAQRAVDVVLSPAEGAPPQNETSVQRRSPVAVQPARRTTIRIRSSWAVGDASGVWRRGTSEHTIEIDD